MKRALVLAVGMSASAPALAAEPPLSNEARAEQLFRAGEKKYDSGRYAEACVDFGESLKLGPQLGTLLNLALCHETTGRVATAWREFHHAAAWAAQNGQKDRHAFAMQHITALQMRLPRVVLHLPAVTAIETVEVDGEPLPATHWYLPLYLDPGEHALGVDAPGKERTTVTFRVTSSPTEQIVRVPPLRDREPEPEVAAPSLPADERGPSGRRVAGFVVLGVGAAGLAVATTFGILALGKLGEARDHCDGDVCAPEGARAYRAAEDRALVSVVSLPVAIVGAAVGGWLAFGPENKAGSARVGVTPRAGGAAVALSATF
jgi:hypothetical protein